MAPRGIRSALRVPKGVLNGMICVHARLLCIALHHQPSM